MGNHNVLMVCVNAQEVPCVYSLNIKGQGQGYEVNNHIPCTTPEKGQPHER